MANAVKFVRDGDLATAVARQMVSDVLRHLSPHVMGWHYGRRVCARCGQSDDGPCRPLVTRLDIEAMSKSQEASVSDEKFMRDKAGRAIQPGDVLKVFHFIGARRKRHYMYKQALRYERGRLLISHLNCVDDAAPRKYGDHYYCEAANDTPRSDYEIVQSAK